MTPLRGKVLNPEEGAALREMFEGDTKALDGFLCAGYPQRAEGGLGEDRTELDQVEHYLGPGLPLRASSVLTSREMDSEQPTRSGVAQWRSTDRR